MEVVRATQNVFGGGVEEKVERAKDEENKVEKGAFNIFVLRLTRVSRKIRIRSRRKGRV